MSSRRGLGFWKARGGSPIVGLSLAAWYEGDTLNDSHNVNNADLTALGTAPSFVADKWGNPGKAFSVVSGAANYVSRAFEPWMTFNGNPWTVHCWTWINGYTLPAVDRVQGGAGQRAWKLGYVPHGNAEISYAVDAGAAPRVVRASNGLASGYSQWSFNAIGWTGSEIWSSADNQTPFATFSESQPFDQTGNNPLMIGTDSIRDITFCRIGLWEDDLRNPTGGNPSLDDIYNNGDDFSYADLPI